MNKRRCHVSTNHAFTLIEVVVGLVLMATLVASTLIALANHQRSLKLAKQKQLASEVAQSLLTQWYELEGDLPARGQGIVQQDGVWFWRTQPIATRNLMGLPINIIRLEIMTKIDSQAAPMTLASVEVIQNARMVGQ